MKRLRQIILSGILLAVFAAIQTIDIQGGNEPLVDPARHLKFTHLTVEDGLSQNHGTHIIQDSEGFMWIGTEDGLNRYDGYTFTVYAHDSEDDRSLSDDFITALYEDRAGMLWIGTKNGGLNTYDRTTGHFTRYRHDSDVPHSLSHNHVLTIYEDHSGTLWIGTRGGGLNQFDRETGQFTAYRHDPGNSHSLSHDAAASMVEDPSGFLWIATEGGGLNRFDLRSRQANTGDFVSYRHEPDTPDSLSDDTVWSLYRDHAGILWLGTVKGGLNRFDPETEQFTRYRHDPDDSTSISYDELRDITEDASGDLWIGTSGGGLNRFDRETEAFTTYRHNADAQDSLSHNTIASVYVDRAGTLWVGTVGKGINLLDPNTQKFSHLKTEPGNPNSLSYDFVMGVYEDSEGILWVGTIGGGVNAYDRTTRTFTHYTADPDTPGSISANRVWTITEDHAETLWMGTLGGGLNAFNRDTRTFRHYTADPENPNSLGHNVIWTLYTDRHGILWIGTFGGGLDAFDPATETFTHYAANPDDPESLSHNVVKAIYEDRSGTLWVGTDEGGLNRLNRDTHTFTHYRADPDNPQSLSNDRIKAIQEDHTGTLWIGTGSGLNRFTPDATGGGAFTRYLEKDGLPNDVIYGILEDDVSPDQGGPSLWLSTNKGLSRFNPRTKTFKNYDVRDGLQGNEFNAGAFYKSARGEMFFGGVSGVTAFFPEKITDNPYRPPVVLTDFQIFNKSVPIGADSPLSQSIFEVKEIVLAHEDSVFSFEFAALNYIIPEKNQYAYRMDGVDNEWVYSGHRRFVTYTNLDPGRYTFTVKGSNNDGVWNEKGRSVAILVHPPWSQTWWAYTLYALTAVGMILGYIRWRLSTTEAQKRQLEIQVAERTHALQVAVENAEVANQAKSAFLANMSHELRSPLNAILGFAQVMARSSTLPPEAQEHVGIIRRSGEHLLTLINQVLDLSKIEAGRTTVNPKKLDLHRLLHDVQDMFSLRAQEKGLHLLFELNESVPRFVRTDEVKLQQVLINLLNNAIKFTAEGGVAVRVGAGSPRPNQDEEPVNGGETSPFRGRSFGGGNSPEAKEANRLKPPCSPPGMGKGWVAKSGVMPVSATHPSPSQEGISGSRSGSNSTKPAPERETPPLRLTFEIEDTGPGIAPEEIEQVFEAFGQTETGRQSLEGTGLGLPISRKFVQLMGGDIRVNSQVGHGTLFTFEIQVQVVEVTKLESHAPIRHVITLEPGQPRYRVLIVDDSWTNRQLVMKLLDPFGFDLREAANGQEAIDIWKTWKPHLIWMDMRMPVLNGYEATKRLKAMMQNRETAIIALTASSFEEERAVVLGAGCDDYLRKPFREEELFELMSRHIGVKFVYEERSKKPGAERVIVTPEALAALPAEWTAALNLAAEKADVEILRDVIAQIRERDESLADALAQLVEDFEYDEILALIRGGAEYGLTS